MQTDSKGRQLTDTLEAFSKGGQRLWYVLSHAAAYTNHPDFPGSMLFDPQSMKPAITNPGWHRALTEYLELSKSVPSDISSLDSYEVRSRFSRGEAAMAIDWTDIGVLAASK
jgi:multiple sugar transport system substrate-binding protein